MEHLAIRLSCAAVATLLTPTIAWSLDFRSVGEAAVLYDAPSKHAKPTFVVARYTPVEVVVAMEGWTKVRDSNGDIAWIARQSLSEKRTLMVTAARAEVRAKPDDAAPVVFQCEKSVALDLIEAAPAGWARVRHRDGASGYVRVSKVWGL